MSSESSPTPLLRPRLLAEGRTDNQLRTPRRTALHTIRPGAYIDTAVWQGIEAETRHRLLIATTVPKLGEGAVISHVSAAVLFGLPVLGMPPRVVHVTRDRSSGGFRRGQLHSHVGPIAAPQTVMVEGLTVTSPARTVVDCACILSFEAALCIADGALRRGLTNKTELTELIDGLGRRRGLQQARRVIAFADHRSESAGESCTRYRLWQIGFPTPSLQFDVCRDGVLIGRTDFAWEEFRTLGEFDGAIKYTQLAPTKEALKRVLLAEKERELGIRGQNWEVVRWTWPELAHPQLLAAKIRHGFVQGRRFL